MPAPIEPATAPMVPVGSGPTAPRGPRQRQWLTLMFTDLVGSTALGRRLEAEDLADLMDQIRAIWHEVVARHGGQVLRTQGDGALVAFGLPQPFEDGGRRAADAALEIHARVVALAPPDVPPGVAPLAMRSGIVAGTVLVSPGDIERGRIDLVGDVANSAARLSQQAAPGQVLVHQAALGPHANFFDLSPALRPDCHAVQGRRAMQRRFDATVRRGLTPLLGRAATLGELQARLAPREGQTPGAGDAADAATAAIAPRCVVLQGNPGMGKTRLLHELMPRLPGTVVYGTCESDLGAEVLQPFRQILAQAPDDGGRGDAAEGVIPGLLARLLQWARQVPLTLVVDDWQWADDASRQLLQALLEQPEGPALLLASRPRDDGTPWIAGAPTLSLASLSPQETQAAATRWLPEVDPFLAARIHDHTGGVPLYIEELCHAASAQSLARALEAPRGTQSWVSALVVARLHAMPPPLKALVQAAAVAGNVVPLALLAEVAEVPCGAAEVQALAEADFLHADGSASQLRFKHGITREAVYEATGLHERQRLHLRLWQALQPAADSGHPGPASGDPGPEILAYHSRGAARWDEAALHAERAGDKATAAFALDRARVQYLAAMEALDRVAERLPPSAAASPSGPAREPALRWCLLSHKLGMTCIFDPLALGDDLRPFERAVQLAQALDDGPTRARARYWLGYMGYGFGRLRDAERHTRQALAEARGIGDLRLAAQVEATLAQVLAASCRYDEALALFDAALAAKQQRGGGAGGSGGSGGGRGIAVGSAYALACKGSILADRGDFAGAHACFDQALALLAGSVHPVANSVRNWVAVALAWQGRWDAAERVAGESARIAENTRGLLLLVVCRAAAGYARWASTGELQGVQQAAEAVRWLDARGGRFYSSLHHGWLVEALLAGGDVAAARRHAAHVLWRTRDGERLGEAIACRSLAREAAARGALARAERWLQRAERSAALRESAREAALNLALRAHLQALQGDAGAAAEGAARAEAELRRLGMPWHAAQHGLRG